MNTIANFFDSPLEKKFSANTSPPVNPENLIIDPGPSLCQPTHDPLQPLQPSAGAAENTTTCHHATHWLDPYGTWRCEICHPPLFESEVRERKNSVAQNSPPEILATENAPEENLDLIKFRPRYFFSDAIFEPWPDELEPCPTCGGIAFWWSVSNKKFCQNCHPVPKRSRELFELAPKLRRLAKQNQRPEK